jgi:hypothetical protein
VEEYVGLLGILWGMVSALPPWQSLPLGAISIALFLLMVWLINLAWQFVLDKVHFAGKRDTKEITPPFTSTRYTTSGLLLRKKLHGEWTYQLTDVESNATHYGECFLSFDDDEMRLTGTRTLSEENGRKRVVTVHWRSTWCQICSDDLVRVDYEINLDNVTHSSLVLSIKEPDEHSKSWCLSGYYHSQGKSLKYGNITFKRVKN